jgi:methionine sulfoxide reductase heme-binding subunit
VLTFASSSKAYWYLTRSTGVVALVLLSAIVILGTLSPMRLAGTERWPRFAIGRLHRDLSLLVLVFLALHIVTSVLDTFAPIAWLDAVIPWHSSYRPLWLGFGALAFDLLVALTITSLVRHRLGYERWRAIHWLAYASWPIAVLHGLGSGSDQKQSWSLLLTLACTAAVLVAIVIRVARALHADDEARAGWIALALATPVGIAIFALQGPLQSGWAARAGTPPTILHPKTATAATVATTTRATRARSFAAALDGQITTQRASGGAIVDMALSLRGATTGVMRIRLAGQPLSSGGISLTGSQVDLSAPQLGSVLAGRVTALSGTSFNAHLRGHGIAYTIHAALQIDPQAGTVTGSLSGTPS